MATQKIPGRAIKLGTDTTGDITYFDGAAWRRLPIGEPGQYLTMNAAGTLPEWFKFVYGGTQFGYAMMGLNVTATNTVDKWSFTSDTNAVDHCDAFAANSHNSCCRSDTHGYSNGGEPVPITNRITKFAFASTADGTDVADLLLTLGSQSGNSSGTYGYCCGGNTVSNIPSQLVNDTIQKYSITADLNATDVGNLTVAKLLTVSANSETHGYTMGGGNSVAPPDIVTSDVIENFPFATDTNSTDVSNLTVDRYSGAGCSSETYGYTCGGTRYGNPGVPSGFFTDVIDKFLFATGADATDVGNLTLPNGNMGGSSSTTNGYVIGGYINYIDRIDKFSFATDGNASDIANLTLGRDNNDGTQN